MCENDTPLQGNWKDPDNSTAEPHRRGKMCENDTPLQRNWGAQIIPQATAEPHRTGKCVKTIPPDVTSHACDIYFIFVMYNLTQKMLSVHDSGTILNQENIL